MKTYKKQFAVVMLSVFFIGTLMTSCSQDDESPAEDISGSILGRWALDKRSYTSNGVTWPEMDYENNQPGCDLNDYFEFKADGVFENGYYDSSCNTTPNPGNWIKNADLITISHPTEDGIILELLSLSSTEMKVRADLTGTDGVEPGLQLYINYTMVKIN